MKPAGSIVTMRMSWQGQCPSIGDVLRSASGRRYRIVEMRGNRWRCRVMSPDEPWPENATGFEMVWAARKKKRQGRAPII